VNILDALAAPVAVVLREIHNGLSLVLPSQSGWAWGLSVVLLTITVRILLFPLFVKQIKSQRKMADLAPKIKALQNKHKGDRETLNVELMKLYKEHGTNPISGCLPLLLQMPVFFALFRVMNELKPKGGEYQAKFGLSQADVQEAAQADVFGAPISAAFNSSRETLALVGGQRATVQVVAAIMVVLMGLTTFITQKQMMARAGTVTDPQQIMMQKILLYVLPFSFAMFGWSFPVGVLLYWLTTNIWSMGQQRYVIARMPIIPPGSGTTTPAEPESKRARRAKMAGMVAESVASTLGQPAIPLETTPDKTNPPAGASKSGQRPTPKGGKKNAGSRKNKNKSKKRR
jgi:YidC/Oxa1 family membrane protein insertase